MSEKINIGNYIISMYEKDEVPVIEVSNSQGTWLVRVPVDFQMYGIVNRLLGDFQSDNEGLRGNARSVLEMYFMNWQNVTGIPNGHYHQAIVMLTACYADPSLLKTSLIGRGNNFYKDVKTLKRAFLKWAVQREKLVKKSEKELDYNREAIADDAKQEINKE